jgi:hypothetical protein
MSKETEKEERDRTTRGVLGDIDPKPSTREHMPGNAGVGDNDDSGEVTHGTTGNVGTEVGGTRNFRQGSGASGGDIGNRPE